MRVKFLKDTEPYLEGDVVDIPDDRLGYVLAEGIAKEVDIKTPLFQKAIAEEKKVKAEEKPKSKPVAENKAVKKTANKSRKA